MPRRAAIASLGATLTALVVVALVTALIGGGAIVGSARAGATPASGLLTWTKCHSGFECATLDVPVDYRHPDGEQVGIAVIRKRATDLAHRIGSLVINFGGPGDPGTETLRLAIKTLPAEVRRRFDIVSFDPRGTGSSRPVDCIDDKTFDRLSSIDSTPDSPAELQKYYDGSVSDVDVIAACIARQGAWLADVGTRNVARDLDRLRIALGERRLTYLGYSYGTVLGAVYAQEFPDNIRALVLDGAVNLSSSAQDQLVRNTAGFEHALGAFLANCAADRSCSYHSGGRPRAALLRLRDRFEGGLTLPAADGRRVGVSEFYVTLLAALYSEQSWPILADALHGASANGDGTLIRLVNDAFSGRRANGTYNNLQEAIGIINCDDRPAPRVSFDSFRSTFDQLSSKYPFFGRVLAAGPTGCDPRLPKPAAGETIGDLHAADAPPILIVGTTHDPATPYAGALDLQRRIASSRLLTVEATQHGGYAQGSVCVDTAVDHYLLQLVLPPRGSRCSATPRA